MKIIVEVKVYDHNGTHYDTIEIIKEDIIQMACNKAKDEYHPNEDMSFFADGFKIINNIE